MDGVELKKIYQCYNQTGFREKMVRVGIDVVLFLDKKKFLNDREV